VTLVSLQKGPGTEQLDELQAFNVVQLSNDVDRGAALFDTAAIMKNLDLVITADTSIAHLAGALGVPVWVPLVLVPDWRWGLEGERTPWYASMRLFRQTKLRDWAGVFERMREALVAEFPKLRPRRPEEYTLATSGFNRVAFTRHGPLIYNRHDNSVGKSLAELGEYSPSEVEVFRQVVRPGATVVEAGAHVGAHTIALARLVSAAGVVHALEPQRVLFQTLAGNIALNSLSHVHCHHAAVGEQEGTIRVPTFDYNRPNNFGALELGAYEDGERVRLTTIDGLNLPRCDFVKLDVSGMEVAALRGARETLSRLRPIVYVASDREQNAPPVIEALLAQGYRLFWHLPRFFQSDNYYGNAENAFGNIASLNILGIHGSVATDIQGLKPITSPQSNWRDA
jgi:FkbM family methyltransferase